MADALTPARRWLALGAILLAGIALGAAIGSGTDGARLGSLPRPSAPTVLLAIAGIVAGALSLASPLALRLLPAISLYATAGLALTKFGPAPGAVFALAPVTFWASRLARGPLGLLVLGIGGVLGVLATAPGLLTPRSTWAVPVVALVVSLAIIGAVVALADPGKERPVPARFDLRAALAIAALVVVGFVVAFAASKLNVYVGTPREYGGLAGGGRSILGLGLLGATLAAVNAVLRQKSLRLLIGLSFLSGGFLLAAALGFLGFALLAVLGTLGALSLLGPSLRRAARAHEALGVGALLLATLVGPFLANSLLTFASRPLPGPIAVAGTEVAARISWPPILLFYGLLALVVLLAHLAHAYEFGIAALDPDDERDPLPILRKGLPKRTKKS